MPAPAAVDPRLEDTAPPGLLARRAWAHPAVVSHAALAMTATRLFLAPTGGGADAELPIRAVRRAVLDLSGHAVTLDADGRRAPVVVRFQDAATADEFFARLTRRAGAGYDLATDRPGFAALARAPLGVMAGVVVATATLAATVGGLPDVADAAGPGWLAALARLDWRVVSVAGGAALTAAQVWLIRRARRPPARLRLVRGAGVPNGDTP